MWDSKWCQAVPKTHCVLSAEGIYSFPINSGIICEKMFLWITIKTHMGKWQNYSNFCSLLHRISRCIIPTNCQPWPCIFIGFIMVLYFSSFSLPPAFCVSCLCLHVKCYSMALWFSLLCILVTSCFTFRLIFLYVLLWTMHVQRDICDSFEN